MILEINGKEDRRIVASILADYGYTVMIEEEEACSSNSYRRTHFLIVEEPINKQEEGK